MRATSFHVTVEEGGSFRLEPATLAIHGDAELFLFDQKGDIFKSLFHDVLVNFQVVNIPVIKSVFLLQYIDKWFNAIVNIGASVAISDIKFQA